MTFERAGVLSADLMLFSDFPSEPSKTVLTLWKKFRGVCHFAERRRSLAIVSKKIISILRFYQIAGCITTKFYN